MKFILAFGAACLLLVAAGCAVAGGYGGAYGVVAEYPNTYYAPAYPAPAYPYLYVYGVPPMTATITGTVITSGSGTATGTTSTADT